MSNAPRTAWNERIYAIGDVHGQLDLLMELMTLIRLDIRNRRRRRAKIIFVGNVIDRGPQSAELMRWLQATMDITDRLIVLRGEQEQLMANALRGNRMALEDWLSSGGAATLTSWGVPHDAINAEPHILFKAARSVISPSVVRWIEALPCSHRSGDFFFVHAGIRPGVPLGAQRRRDLLQIEDEFLDYEEKHPAMIVHGHAACADGPDIRDNRIGINTAAYRTRRLTALGLEGGERWTIST